MDGKPKPIFIVIIVSILVIVAGVGFWYWQKKGAKAIFPQTSIPEAENLSPAEVKESLGGQIFEQTQNPLKGKLPPTNPFEETETNPLKNVYQNPF